MDGLFDALGLATAPVVGHPLGGMLALWHAADHIDHGQRPLFPSDGGRYAFPGCFVRFGARCAGKVGGRGQCDSQGREPVGEDQGPGYGC